MFSKRISKIEKSPTLSLTAKAKAMQAEGLDVVSFSAGEPAFPLFPEIQQMGISAIKQNFNKYTPTAGITELREKIALKLKEENQLNYDVSEVIVANGAKQILHNTLLALTNPGDEIVVAKPYWVSYLEQIRLADGKLKTSETENFQLKADLLRDTMSNKTKAVIINSPNNPTGACISKAELSRIKDVVLEHDSFVLSDEVYEYFTYDDFKHTSMGSLGDEIKERTITINAFSKSFAMTGLRVGYCGAPLELAGIMTRLQDHTTSGASSIAQKMALGALEIPKNAFDPIKKEFEKRRNVMVKRLNELNLTCTPPQGAFYCFPNIATTGMNADTFCAKLLDSENVACIPGTGFGAKDNIRLSFVSENGLNEGLDRIERFMKRIQ